MFLQNLLNSVSFWSCLILSFLTFKVGDIFVGFVFIFIGIFSLFVGGFSVDTYKKRVHKTLKTERTNIDISVDLENATAQDLLNLTKSFVKTMQIFKTIIQTRDLKKPKNNNDN